MMSFLESERFSQQFPAVYQLAGWTDLQDGEKSLEKERGERRSSVAITWAVTASATCTLRIGTASTNDCCSAPGMAQPQCPEPEHALCSTPAWKETDFALRV